MTCPSFPAHLPPFEITFTFLWIRIRDADVLSDDVMALLTTRQTFTAPNMTRRQEYVKMVTTVPIYIGLQVTRNVVTISDTTKPVSVSMIRTAEDFV